MDIISSIDNFSLKPTVQLLWTLFWEFLDFRKTAIMDKNGNSKKVHRWNISIFNASESPYHDEKNEL